MRVSDISVAHQGETPTLAAINQVYGLETSLGVLSSWIVQLCDYVGKGAMTDLQIEEVAILMIRTAYWFKLGEIAIFFMMLKSGEYGKLYGNLNPMWIMEQFQDFKNQRVEKLERARIKELSLKRESNQREWQSEAATPEEIAVIRAKYEPSVNNILDLIS